METSIQKASIEMRTYKVELLDHIYIDHIKRHRHEQQTFVLVGEWM